MIQNPPMNNSLSKVNCSVHEGYLITHFCCSEECLKGLCMKCIKEHNNYHKLRGEFPSTETLEDVSKQCKQALSEFLESYEKEVENAKSNNPQRLLSQRLSSNMYQQSTNNNMTSNKSLDRIQAAQTKCLEIINTYFSQLRQQFQQCLDEENQKRAILEEQVNELQGCIVSMKQTLDILQSPLQSLDLLTNVLKVDYIDFLETKKQTINQAQWELSQSHPHIEVQSQGVYAALQELCSRICVISFDSLKYQNNDKTVNNQQNSVIPNQFTNTTTTNRPPAGYNNSGSQPNNEQNTDTEYIKIKLITKKNQDNSVPQLMPMPVDGNRIRNTDGRDLEYTPVSEKMKTKAFETNLNNLSNIQTSNTKPSEQRSVQQQQQKQPQLNSALSNKQSGVLTYWNNTPIQGQQSSAIWNDNQNQKVQQLLQGSQLSSQQQEESKQQYQNINYVQKNTQQNDIQLRSGQTFQTLSENKELRELSQMQSNQFQRKPSPMEYQYN